MTTLLGIITDLHADLGALDAVLAQLCLLGVSTGELGRALRRREPTRRSSGWAGLLIRSGDASQREWLPAKSADLLPCPALERGGQSRLARRLR